MKRKRAPKRDVPRPEERNFLAPPEHDEGGGGDGGGGEGVDWAAGEAGLEDSDDSEGYAWRPVKRGHRHRRRRRVLGGEEDGPLTVAVQAAPPAEQRWRFAELAVEWREAGSSSSQQRLELEDGQLRLCLPPDGGDVRVHYQASGGALWLGATAAPPAEGEALLLLLKSGHLSCSVPALPSGASGSASGRLHLSLTDKAAADAAEHAEEQQQRQWHRQLLAVLRWLLPQLDPEQELELQSPQKQAELLASPLCSPRAAAGAAAAGFGNPAAAAGTAAAGLASPRSPGAAAGGVPGAAAGFDVSELYAAVKPTGREPELPACATAAYLLPTLRRYQARAAQWMVLREQGLVAAPGEAAAAAAAAGGSQAADIKAEEGHQARDGAEPPLHPLWRRVPCSAGGGDGSSSDAGACFFVNAYNGRISLERFPATPEVRGGILSDEMGLGKTVELLACIAAHPYTGPPPTFQKPQQGGQRGSKRRAARVACLCGATSEEGYEGLWLQCDSCDTWLHAACCGLRRAPPGDFVCGGCQRAAAAARVAQDCGATLVVCPTPILHQWRDEILRHIKPGALRLLIYEGQPQPGAGAASKVVTAAELAAADIVLTSYDVLRRDVNHCPDEAEQAGAGRSLRWRKKYEVMPTPLTRLRWWRVCLDEAQMVESSTAKAAEMALKLHTVHRWCVTGTPVSRSLEDIYGLLAFLQASPYSNRHWWQRAVQQPYEAGSRAGRARLLSLLRPALGGLLWRSSKADVAHELGLPPQHHHLKSLQMSAIERHFYSRQHQECVAKARAALSSQLLAAATAAAAAHDGVAISDSREAGAGAAAAAEAGAAPASPPAVRLPPAATAAAGFEDRALTRREEASLLHPLLRLRQACCHPQVGGAGIRAVGPAGHNRSPMTMGEVLEVMLAKARVEAEDAQRLLLASLNGLAGLLLLQEQPVEAVRAYREALATIEQNKSLIRADKLQQLHTLTNLAAVLGPEGRSVEGAAPTLRDAWLETEAQEIREEYLAESLSRLTDAAQEVEEVQRHVQRCKAPLLQHVSAAEAEELLAGWYMRGVALIVAHGRDHHTQRAVAERIKEQVKEETMYLRSVSQNAASIASRFRDLHGLELAVKQEVRELGRAQAEATQELQRLQAACRAPPPALVELAATCSRCRAETAVAGRVCRHCRLEELFWSWEGRAFALYSKAREGGGRVTADDAIRQAQQATLFNRVGRGGLGEAAAEQLGGSIGDAGGEDEEGGHHLLLGAGRRDDAVAKTEIVRRPGDAENVLRLLLHQLRLVKVPQEAAAEKDLVMTAGKAHLELMEQYRRLYLKARALSLAQRQRLYAVDELEQCTMRIKLLSDNELRLKEGEEIYRVYEHEVPVRSTELSNDKASAELELHRKLGTLRYLTGIKAREAARAAAAAAAEAQVAAAAEEDAAAGPMGDGVEEAGTGAAGKHSVAPAAGAGRGEPGVDAGLPCQPAASEAGTTAAARGLVAAAAGEEDREDICPICHDRLGQEMVMLACAHRLCCRCSVALQERLPAGQPKASRRIECPVCRTRVPVSDLVYIDARLASPGGKRARGEEAEGEGDIEVKGSYGTKVSKAAAQLLAVKLLLYSLSICQPGTPGKGWWPLPCVCWVWWGVTVWGV